MVGASARAQRWQSHHGTRHMWANNPHLLKYIFIKVTKRSSRMDLGTTTFGMKKDTIIGFWNVRTLYQAGKLRQLTAEAERYKVDILGVSEVRWNEFGEVKIAAGQTFLYSGKPNEDDLHQEGVAEQRRVYLIGNLFHQE